MVSAEMLGAVGAAIWVMVLVAQVRRRRVSAGRRASAARRPRRA